MSGFPVATTEGIARDDFNTLIANLKYNPFLNLLANGSFERTTHGDSQCDYWQESGVVNVRSSAQKKYGGYSCLIVPTLITDHSFQDLIDFEDLKGIKVAFGCWVYAPAASCILRISDGVGSTDSVANTSLDSWEFLYVARTIDSAATQVRVELRPTGTSGNFYFDGAILVCGEEPPRSAMPPMDLGVWIRKSLALSADPSWYAEKGDEYFNTTSTVKKVFDGSSWVDV